MTIIFEFIPFVCLFVLLIVTRRYDSFCWWLFRLLITCSLICFIYVHIDHQVGALFIRFGDVALSLAMLLFWRLTIKQTTPQSSYQDEFCQKINKILNKEFS